VLKVKKLYKSFRLYKKPSDRIFEVLFNSKRHTNCEVLKNINFRLGPGESLGVIGPNGAGKSTLLKLIVGILLPDSGQIDTSGRIAGLVELGTGFNPELTGLENVKNNALLLGMSANELNSKLDNILDFAELGPYIQNPLKTYSSGMVMRLAFATAVHSDPECFVVDEALSVGDSYFQQKCIRKIMDFRSKGGSLLFVSHDLNAVKLLCSNVLVLDEGEVVAYENPEGAVNFYNKLISRYKPSVQDSERNVSCGYGTLRAIITEVSMNGLTDNNLKFTSGQHVTLKIKIRCNDDIRDFVIGFMIRDRFGQDIFGTNTYLSEIDLSPKKGAALDVDWNFDLNIGVGGYSLSVALHRGPDHTVECLHWQDAAMMFEITGFSGNAFAGLCRLEPTFNVQIS
tara:strand:+ start:19899 stop:21092 length:1194 start_codon:yes stop_codon:yes gene_type:complete